jgi:hypothetical protein
MQSPRFTIRTLMVAVAVVGVIVAGGVECNRLYRLSALYQIRASGFASLDDGYRQDFLDREQVLAQWVAQKPRTPEEKQRMREALEWDLPLQTEWIQYSHAMRTKYERTARYPWLPAAPDPREPKSFGVVFDASSNPMPHAPSGQKICDSN